jgi:hypothetical protein
MHLHHMLCKTVAAERIQTSRCLVPGRVLIRILHPNFGEHPF